MENITNQTRMIPEPVCSSDSIWYRENDDLSISDVLDDKAEVNHTHSGYAPTSHTHTEYAATVHEHTGYAAEEHTHSEYAPLSVLPTSATGDVKENLTGKDVLATIAAKPIGMYTFYAAATGTVNNPRSTGSWRFLCHKTTATFGWVMAFCGDGSVYSNYLDTGNWQGWRVIYDASTPTALWTGAKVMTNTETITPTKPLSECRNGWMLEWSDYNEDSSSAANTNFVQLPIYKRNTLGAWDGKNMIFRIPNYISDDGTTVGNATKQLIVYNNKLVGHVANDKNTANLDVCLRAVYEF